ncbi:MAG: TIGR01244 family sulfur transferase [Pseudomonadota bacterium]
MDLEYLTEDYAVTGQIKPEDLAVLKGQGFNTVLCHRPDHEGEGQPEFSEIAAAAEALGMKAAYLPVAIPQGATEEDHAAYRDALAVTQGPVLAYCKGGGRAKNMWKAAQG